MKEKKYNDNKYKCIRSMIKPVHVLSFFTIFPIPSYPSSTKLKEEKKKSKKKEKIYIIPTNKNVIEVW